MTKPFKIYTRRSNEGEWSLYGTFACEQDFRDEMPNIRWLGLSIKRVG